ncbi:unnamed protein product [Closterium sp. NIES-64]|nr:unnamed protein product [Closterium sp. NIES-64]
MTTNGASDADEKVTENVKDGVIDLEEQPGADVDGKADVDNVDKGDEFDLDGEPEDVDGSSGRAENASVPGTTAEDADQEMVNVDTDGPDPQIPGYAIRYENVRRSFADLQAKSAMLASCIAQWKELDEFFAASEERLRKREQDVSERERALEEKTRTVTKQLDKRESAIASRESASMQRVQEQRDAAFAALAEERKKWMEEKEKSREKDKAASGKGKEGSDKARRESERKESSDKAEKDKKEKENEREKEKEKLTEEKKKEEEKEKEAGKIKEEARSEGDKEKDKASASARAARAASEDKSSGKQAGTEAPASEPASNGVATAANTAERATATPKDAKSDKTPRSGDESGEAAVRVSAELRGLCAGMDAEGLKRYVMQNRRDISRVRTELPHALPLALDPCRLVLSCLDSYKPKAVEAPAAGKDKRREPVEPSHVRAVSLLVETLGQVLAKQAKAEGVSVPVIAPSIQEKARGILDGWVRSGGPLSKAEEASSLDAWLVLQVAAVFGVARQVDEDALLGFVASSARRKQTADMVKAMGIVDKMPGGEYTWGWGVCPDILSSRRPIELSQCTRRKQTADMVKAMGLMEKKPVVVERLVKEGREVDAIYLAHGVDLLDSVDPVDLLKRNLREIRTLVSAMTKKDKSLQAECHAVLWHEIHTLVSAMTKKDKSLQTEDKSLQAENEATSREISMMRALIRCVDDCSLKPRFSTDHLTKRIEQLEKNRQLRKQQQAAEHSLTPSLIRCVDDCNLKTLFSTDHLTKRIEQLEKNRQLRKQQAQVAKRAAHETRVQQAMAAKRQRLATGPVGGFGGGGGGGVTASGSNAVTVANLRAAAAARAGQGQAAYSLGGAGMAGGGAIYATASGGPGSLGQEVVYGVGTMGSALTSPGAGAGLGGGLYAAGGVGGLGNGLGGTVTYLTDAGAGPQLLVQRGMYGGEVGAAGTTVYYAVQGDQGQGGGGVGGGVGGAQVSAGQATYDYQTGSYVGGGYQGGYGR